MRALRPVTPNAQVVDYQRNHFEVTGQGWGEEVLCQTTGLAELENPSPRPSPRAPLRGEGVKWVVVPRLRPAWSCWPDNLKPPEGRPPWLRVEGWLGELGIPRYSPAGCRQPMETRHA